ncbi:hypothetical protein CVIRNUC_004077 [Coccomyxa viridis]|uniref:Uncharacterized protein n=1 Tax=Coccomyxa viridis TaxID=1274662 RepID=A0AAV1I1M2_9CHLO|nr:hypothetical protein CVIRNUC_004077 [Coccomyxa viridis]
MQARRLQQHSGRASVDGEIQRIKKLENAAEEERKRISKLEEANRELHSQLESCKKERDSYKESAEETQRSLDAAEAAKKAGLKRETELQSRLQSLISFTEDIKTAAAAALSLSANGDQHLPAAARLASFNGGPSDAGPSAEEEAKTALSLAKDKGKTRAGPPQLQGPMKRPKSVLKSAYWSGEQNARNKGDLEDQKTSPNVDAQRDARLNGHNSSSTILDRCSRGLGKIGKWLWCNMCSTSKEGCMIITRVAVGSVVLAAAAFNITGAIVKWPEWYSVPLDVEVMTLLRTIGKDHAKAVDKLDRF